MDTVVTIYIYMMYGCKQVNQIIFRGIETIAGKQVLFTKIELWKKDLNHIKF